MYLSKLELVGFKSFAPKTAFKFSEGISAVVGPNGCGKTNVVDAIRWVLGEQKTAILRSDLMENVIFNGTKNRKPLGMAEVSLTIQNNKQRLPIEYSEVMITRRLFRDGESQYLLNNTQCRLKDIVDLFMDTGMGSDSYSVIELKMVEDILNGKAEERRHLFEEAAGVTKYKLRRKETDKKLQSVQEDLLRVQDIVGEIQKNVGSLARQAAKTRKYNKLMEEFKKCELDILKYDYINNNKILGEISLDLEQLISNKSIKEKELDDTEKFLLGLENQHKEIDNSFKTASTQEKVLNSQFAQKTKEIAVAQERISALNQTQARTNREIDETQNYLERTKNNILSTKDKIEELGKNKIEFEQTHSENVKAKNVAYQNLFDLREEANSINGQQINLQNKINSIKSNRDRISSRKNQLESKHNASQKDVDSIIHQIEQVDNELLEKQKSDNDFTLNIKNAEEQLNQAQEFQASLQTDAENLQKQITDKKDKLNRQTASRDFLAGLIDSGETTKFLINSKDWKPQSEKLLLSEAVSIDSQFQVALHAALGETAQYIIVDKKEDAINAVSVLEKNNKGKAIFICRELVPEYPLINEEINDDGVFGWASQLCTADETIMNSVRSILGKTAIVESLDAGWNIINNQKADSAVTLKGEIVTKSGLMRGGSAIQTEGRTIGKSSKIKKLNTEIASLQNELSELENNLREIRQKLSEINIREKTDNLRKHENFKTQNERNISQLKYKKESFEKNIELIKKNSAGFQEEIVEIENEFKKYSEELVNFEAGLIEIKEKFSLIQLDVKSSQENYEKLNDTARKSEMQIVQLDTELKNTDKDLERLSQTETHNTRKIEQLNAELIKNNENIQELIKNVEFFEKELDNLKQDSDKAQSEREYFSGQLASFQEQIQQYTAVINNQRKEYSRLSESIHQKDLKRSEIILAIKNIITRATEQLEINLETEEITIDEGFSPEESKSSIAIVKEKLTALGSVNFIALEEFEAQSERLRFYEEQVNDLQESEKTLQKTILEINNTAEEKFLATFEQIKTNFKGLFHILFSNEAEAELKLAEGNPLECDIEIIARPPGKKPHSIEALSGGEKTLTAIALLFGIYLVKPSPFCILDEVDAPLDDANIGKFLDLIKQFSTETQFLIVTHNKKTMESASTLYGITMQEEGVSKVVSVKFNDVKEAN